VGPGQQGLAGILGQLRQHFDRRRPELPRPDHVGERAHRLVGRAAASKRNRKQDRGTDVPRRPGPEQRSPQRFAFGGRYPPRVPAQVVVEEGIEQPGQRALLQRARASVFPRRL